VSDFNTTDIPAATAGLAPPTIPGLANFRDVGGLPTVDGGVVRTGRLYRSSAPSALGPGGFAAVRALGLRAVLDLRDHYELEHEGYELGDPQITRLHVAVLGDRPVPPDQPGLYTHMIENCAAGFAEAVRTLARADSLPALVHCAVGKDRTGVTVALTLSAVGVPDDAIAADYVRSNAGLGIAEPDPDAPQDPYQTGRSVHPALILDVLARARRLGGDVPGYLAGHGVTAAELHMLRDALVEP
jgi:protein-tyrosine phosphatase